MQGIWISLSAMINPFAVRSNPSPAAIIAHVTTYGSELGVAISQACYATGVNHERAMLTKLLG